MRVGGVCCGCSLGGEDGRGMDEHEGGAGGRAHGREKGKTGARFRVHAGKRRRAWWCTRLGEGSLVRELQRMGVEPAGGFLGYLVFLFTFFISVKYGLNLTLYLSHSKK